MPELSHKAFTDNLFALLTETFEGSSGPSFYLDRGVGFLDTLENLSAETASRVFYAGTSIAAQVEHSRFYLDVLEQSLNGRTEKIDWAESWQVTTVNADEWDSLQRDLRTAYQSVIQTLNTTTWDDDAVGDSLGLLAHSAYHLGAIRQMMRAFDEA